MPLLLGGAYSLLILTFVFVLVLAVTVALPVTVRIAVVIALSVATIVARFQLQGSAACLWLAGYNDTQILLFVQQNFAELTSVGGNRTIEHDLRVILKEGFEVFVLFGL